MIQRIQSVYLSISILLIGLLFFLPFAEIVKDGSIYLFNFKGVLLDGAVKEGAWIITVLLVFIIALHILAIFSYKNRKQQIKIVYFAILLLVGLLGAIAFYTYSLFSGALFSFKFGVGLPLVAIILDYLAIRAIGKDEALIRSIDRIR